MYNKENRITYEELAPSLQELFKNLQTQISKEVERARNEDLRLDRKIDDEADRAKQREDEIEAKLDDEIQRSTQKDQEHDSALTTINTSIDSINSSITNLNTWKDEFPWGIKSCTCTGGEGYDDKYLRDQIAMIWHALENLPAGDEARIKALEDWRAEFPWGLSPGGDPPDLSEYAKQQWVLDLIKTVTGGVKIVANNISNDAGYISFLDKETDEVYITIQWDHFTATRVSGDDIDLPRNFPVAFASTCYYVGFNSNNIDHPHEYNSIAYALSTTQYYIHRDEWLGDTADFWVFAIGK